MPIPCSVWVVMKPSTSPALATCAWGRFFKASSTVSRFCRLPKAYSPNTKGCDSTCAQLSSPASSLLPRCRCATYTEVSTGAAPTDAQSQIGGAAGPAIRDIAISLQ